MIDYIKYTIDDQTYELINNKDGTWARNLNAPSVAGLYNLLLEIGQAGIVTYIDSKDPRYHFYLQVIEEVERKVDLIKKIPHFLRKSDVFKEIFYSENTELDYLHNEIHKISLNTFIRTASIEKITDLETFLRFKGQGNLEQRRSYLLSMYQKNKKVNESLIKEIANTITGSDCIITFFNSNKSGNPYIGHGLLRIQVLSPNNNKDYRYEDIERTLKPLIPTHIKLLVIKYFATWGDVTANFADWTAVNSMDSWQNIKNFLPMQ